MLLYQQITKHEQIKCNISINWHDHIKTENHRKRNWKRNLNTQCLWFFVNSLFVNQQRQHFVDNWKINKQNRNEAHFVENFQFTSFTVRQIIEIHSTCYDE